MGMATAAALTRPPPRPGPFPIVCARNERANEQNERDKNESNEKTHLNTTVRFDGRTPPLTDASGLNVASCTYLLKGSRAFAASDWANAGFHAATMVCRRAGLEPVPWGWMRGRRGYLDSVCVAAPALRCVEAKRAAVCEVNGV